MFLSLSVPCPTCRARIGDRCRTMTTDQETTTHRKRIEHWLDNRHPIYRRHLSRTAAASDSPPVSGTSV